MKNKATVLFLFLFASFFSHGQGFDSGYRAYSGDFNNDGLTDFYVKKPASPFIPIINDDITFFIPNNQPAPVDPQEFVLQQTSNHRFTIQSNLSNSQKQMLSQWPEVAVELVLEDFNLDGVLDIFLKGVPSIISSSFNQIVFASPSTNQPPQVVTAVDNNFKQFFEEVYNWIVNPNYFEDNVPSGTYLTTHVTGAVPSFSSVAEFMLLCHSRNLGNCAYSAGSLFSWIPANTGRSCASVVGEVFTLYGATGATKNSLDQTVNHFCDPTWTGYIIYVDNPTPWVDYSVFNQDVMAMEDILEQVFVDGESSVSESEVQEIESILGNTMGIAIDLPLPGTVPDTVTKPKLPKLSWFGHLMILLDLASAANDYVESKQLVFHFTDSDGRDEVLGGAPLEPPSGGPVFFTNLAYPTSDIAMDKLGLCGPTKVGFFIVDKESITGLSSFSPVPGPLSCIENGEVRTGGGLEATAPPPVDPGTPRRYIPIVESY